ncbi:TRL-like family protein [Alcanivorax quisquiliarum]|uniref:TRL-like family protein n=1 Tax=Alcanivorax quisquiliarum TaxID=2933565 RepID=A0ABT0E840_9GAMM|nr:TRL-like family protein [Alcanivorax quisquiliarum]MCK0538011.1 TRL-like family protein [Alcanivorax quisquiliarum]
MRNVGIIVLMACAVTLSGCAVHPFQSGLLFSQQKMPLDTPNQSTSCAKKGTGSSTNLLGLVAFGDASVASAKAEAGIRRVDSVDIAHTGLLGLVGVTSVEVCGE